MKLKDRSKRQTPKFKGGELVRIRSWEDMEAEFGIYGRNINVPYSFTPEMRHLCGRTARVRGSYSFPDFIDYILCDWSDDSGDISWDFSEEMLEALEKVGE